MWHADNVKWKSISFVIKCLKNVTHFRNIELEKICMFPSMFLIEFELLQINFSKNFAKFTPIIDGYQIINESFSCMKMASLYWIERDSSRYEL